MQHFETLVVGLGAMGAATVWQLARRGRNVLGIDRHSPPHDLGSSHGDTRITRLAIGEGSVYTPLATRSHALWRELERASGRSLLTTCGGLVISSASKSSVVHAQDFFGNTVAAARDHGIAHELLDAAQIRRRFPAFAVADDEQGYYEPTAGFVRPETCVRTELELAEAQGAVIRRDERVLSFDAGDRRVEVVTDRQRYTADRVVVAAGAYLPGLVDARIARHFKVYRQVLLWYHVRGSVEPFLPSRFPVFIWELQGRTQAIYGFPAIDGAYGGVKVATEQYVDTTSADAMRREVTPHEIDNTYDRLVAPFVRGLDRDVVKTATCLYTVTPDFGFVIDTHPDSARVMIASPCSGHGFKHSAAIGEALAQWACGEAPAVDFASFRLARFG